MNFKKMIDMIKLRPGAYIGNINLDTLQAYIDGYLISSIMNNIEDDFEVNFRKYFNFWIQHEIRMEYKLEKEIYNNLEYNNARGYPAFIALIDLDSKKQLDMFFKYFDLFYEDFMKGMDFEAIKQLYSR